MIFKHFLNKYFEIGVVNERCGDEIEAFFRNSNRFFFLNILWIWTAFIKVGGLALVTIQRTQL